MIFAKAICIIGFRFITVDNEDTTAVNGVRRSIPTNVPMILNTVCNAAVLLAASVPPRDARIPVTVVPILAPNMNGRDAPSVIALA